MNRLRRGLVTGVVPAVVALLVSLVVLAIVLAVLGVDPVKSLKALFDFGPTPRAEANQIRTWINRSVPLFLSGLAVAIVTVPLSWVYVGGVVVVLTISSAAVFWWALPLAVAEGSLMRWIRT